MSVVPSVWIPYPRPAASVELRSGVLYRGCQCVKRDGLQQDCPRSECQGRASCLDYPAPTCIPSGNAPRPYPGAGTARGAPPAPPGLDNHYLHYKQKLDEKYRGFRDYVENPAVHARANIPCRIHRRK